MKRGEYWVTKPYCYCHGAALFAVNGLRHVPHVNGMGLVPLPGLSRDETAILAAILMALAFFLFLMFFIFCLLCPWWRKGVCCGSKHGAGGLKKSEHLTEVDYKLPRAWLDTFKGIPEDQFDAKIKELETGGWAGMSSDGLGYGAGSRGLGSGGGRAGGEGLASGSGIGYGGGYYKMSSAEGHTGSRIRGVGASSGVEDATGDFFFHGDAVSRSTKHDATGDSGFSSQESRVMTSVAENNSSYDRSGGYSHGGETTSTTLVRRKHDESSALVSGGTLRRVALDTGSMGKLKKVQVVKETNQRTTTTFDKAGNKNTTRSTTTSYNTSGGLGSRLLEMIQGITGFGVVSGGRQLSIKGRQTASSGTHLRQLSSGTLGRQTISGGTERFVSNLAEESQISSNMMEGRNLSIRGTKGRQFLATGGHGSSGSGTTRRIVIKTTGGGGGVNMLSNAGGLGSVMSSSGGSANTMSRSEVRSSMRSSSGGSMLNSGGSGLITSVVGGGTMSLGGGAMVSSSGGGGAVMSRSGGGGAMSMMSSSGGGGGVATVSTGRLAGGMTGGTGDYLFQREVQREFNITNPENFMKLYNAYRRYLTESSGLARV
ncbi:uncharacterized transmembrane protein DDB_G0289901-like [Haliotis asinina]|uniref:uncharacterized transmembrane protein DDB_G0289901-like n=1 Tax=Haliotis asinina TaxID=109174 RepID=UPI003532509A